MDEIKKLLEIKDGENFILDADEVAKITGKHRESVYASRKKDCKLDKLAIFEKIKNIVENETKSETKITGDKSGVLNGLDGMLKESNKYEIIIREA
jgi:hypothetical protein